MMVFRNLRWPAAHALFVALTLAASLLFFALTGAARAGGKEYVGKLEPQLVPNPEETEDIVFKPLRDLSKIKLATPLGAGHEITAGRLYHPPQDKAAILTLLVEPEDDAPYLYADLNLDNVFADNERFALKRGEDDNPYLLETTLQLPTPNTPFQSYPILVQYFKGVEWDEMKDGERFIQQSKEAFARGVVDIEGRKTFVQYVYTGRGKKISASNGWLGVDGDGDGEILIDKLSPESAFAREETVVFRVGQSYVSTKRVDLEKNEIVLRAHEASEYKRVELRLGGEVPDFAFTDFNGKKRKLSDFRGKYVLIDFWGLWCPPCRRELPYLKTAYSRFQARGFEILGMDDDEDTSAIKAWLKENNLTWTQATNASIKDVMRSFRITSFPTTLLVGPDGKIISLNQKNQPPLRGRALLESLDELLPP
jgi:peroxiredoxin